MFTGGLTRPKRNKLGLFYVQLCYEQQPDNQPLAVGIDPGSSFEGFSVVPARLHRRQLHRLQASKGGIRKLYGGTRSLGLKRGTLVRHAKYGLCTVGGFDRKKQTISLHGYRTNKRLTQGAKVKDCRICTWMAFRSWLVSLNSKKGGAAFPPAP